MTEAYAKYRRLQIAELADWHEGFDMERVSISAADKDAGSPKLGDKIARNPANHDDKWLVAADYFAANFEPVTVSDKGEAEALLKSAREKLFTVSGSALLAGEKCKKEDARTLYELVCSANNDLLCVIDDLSRGQVCEHDRGLTDYCQPCGRVNGGG